MLFMIIQIEFFNILLTPTMRAVRVLRTGNAELHQGEQANNSTDKRNLPTSTQNT